MGVPVKSPASTEKQLILSDALLAVIGKTIKRTLVDKKGPESKRNKADRC